MIFLIIFSIVCLAMLIGFISTRIKFSKNRVDLDKYTGEFRDILSKGKRHLDENGEIKNIRIVIYTGTDLDAPSYASRTGIFLKPTVTINELQMRNEGWRRDFNAVARAWGLPESENNNDNALFLLFHEYRHCLQTAGQGTDYVTLPLTDENKKNILPYRLIPNESDADHYAFIQLKTFKEKNI